MLFIIMSVLLAYIYTFFIAFIHNKIIHVASKKQWSYEWGLFISSIITGGISAGVFQLHLPFFAFNSFLKAGITISIIMLVISPTLWLLKRKNKHYYTKLIRWLEK